MTSPAFKITILLCILIGLNLNDLYSQGTYSLEVKIDGVMINKGTFHIALYNSEAKFQKETVSAMKLSNSEFTGKVFLKDLMKGEYALILYQDLNDNDLLDKAFGVPIEPYGISNNVSGFPTFRNAKFSLTNNQTIKINIKN
jgi:uncharacterized protein (DUF2141 family)